MNDITHLLRQSVQIESFSGKSGYGEFSYSDPVTYPARVDYKIQKISNKDGAETVSKAVIYVEVEAHLQDRIVVDDDLEPFILAVTKVYDVEGRFHHSEVYM